MYRVVQYRTVVYRVVQYNSAVEGSAVGAVQRVTVYFCSWELASGLTGLQQ